MKSYTLGPPVETFGPSIRITTVFGAFGLFACTMAFLVAHELEDSTAWRIFFALAFMFSGLLLWQLSFRAAIHQIGISCRNIFFTKELPWQDVDRYYYFALGVRLNFIPLGEFYSLKLRSLHGQSISFTNHIGRHEELVTTIAQCTFKPLAEKALQFFDAGSAVNFEAITVSRAGITLRKLFFSQETEWQQIKSYDVNASSVTFGLREGLLRSRTISSRKVANPPVLKFLLDHVMQRV